ncbi:leucyl/phenylalanyl-tRNA--protein transferase [Altibacter sp.]|uniref:leucyl/phenylalanyl-tRNA--protein transferase n=1 Tax=Altibacter sp. TaxID=2024823 RepID=UPI000C8A16B2|nr:leucyl/phenylalanyl-tRNA--protein transferase [Altibacter sp.]MAP53656.1 leucyl/phenylalanyl-tRNA--protein transferase [Altibacter sp.]
MYLLNESLSFPSVTESTEDGLLAMGGDLSTARLLLAYRSGIFPWYEDGSPILWWSPDPRMVLFPNDLRVSKSLRKVLKRKKFSITYNIAFNEVIKQCAVVKRKAQHDTWITSEMIMAYTRLHELGHAVSVEVWYEGVLVGGLYGIDLPEFGVFCGESMFSLVSEASKVAFFHLVEHLKTKNYKLIDCQVYTQHLARLGAVEMPRAHFLAYLNC